MNYNKHTPMLIAIVFIFTMCSIKQGKKVETFWDFDKLKLKEIYYVSEEPPYLKNGSYKMYDEDAKLIKEYEYSDGELDGVCTDYYSDGQINEQYTFKKGIKEGDFKFYSKDVNGATIESKGSFKNNEYDGLYTKTNVETGNLEIRHNFKDGKKNGKCDWYFPNGNLSTSNEYKNDLRDGKSIEYFENGNIKVEATYKDDKINGLFKSYYENGKLEVETEIVNDKKNGMCKVYYSNGQLYQNSTFNQDIKSGKETVFSRNGLWELNNEFVNDELQKITPVKINSSDKKLKEFAESNFYSFGSSVANQFNLFAENEQMKIEYRIVRNFERDSVIVFYFNIIPKDSKFKPLIACSIFTILDDQNRTIINFDCGGNFAQQKTQKDILIEGVLSEYKNFDCNFTQVVLSQFEGGSCGNEESIAKAYGYGNLYKRNTLIVEPNISPLFCKLVRTITN